MEGYRLVKGKINIVQNAVEGEEGIGVRGWKIGVSSERRKDLTLQNENCKMQNKKEVISGK